MRYDQIMIEEEQDKMPEVKDTTSVTSGDMSEALDAAKAASPALAGALDAAGVTPGGLADSHERATPGYHDAEQPAGDAEQPAGSEGNEQA